MSMSSSRRFSKDFFTDKVPELSAAIRNLDRSRTLNGEAIRYLEVGSMEGRSLLWMLDNGHCSEATCIDTWSDREHERNFDFNVAIAGYGPQVTKMRHQSCKALRWLPMDFFHIAYIDGCHEPINVLEDAVLVYRLVKRGGIIIFDDYLYKKVNIKDAIDRFIETYDLEVILKSYQIAVKKG